MARGEEWCFTRYRSINEVHIGSERVARDVLLLSQQQPASSPFPTTTTTNNNNNNDNNNNTTVPPRTRTLRPRTLADTLAPYACYATLLLAGPATAALAADLASAYDGIRQMQVRRGRGDLGDNDPLLLLWSLSPLADGRGCIVRVAGVETDGVRAWLREHLRGLEAVIGRDAYARAFV